MNQNNLRASERRPVKLNFSLGGRDAKGRVFEEVITTRNMSEGGGSFTSATAITVGSTLKISGQAGFISLIRIAWSQKVSSSDAWNFGFQFVHPLEDQ